MTRSNDHNRLPLIGEPTSIERTACPPWGLEGGGEGVPGRVEIERADGSREVLLKGEASVRAGDRVVTPPFRLAEAVQRHAGDLRHQVADDLGRLLAREREPARRDDRRRQLSGKRAQLDRRLGEPTARDVANLIRQVREQKTKALFIENMTNPALVAEIARDSGAVVGPRLYSDALSKPGGPAPTYEAMMRHNVSALVAGMQKN